MTTNAERVYSIRNAEHFLLQILHGNVEASEELRREAGARLRHYPTALDLEQMLRPEYVRHLEGNEPAHRREGRAGNSDE